MFMDIADVSRPPALTARDKLKTSKRAVLSCVFLSLEILTQQSAIC